MGSLKAYNESTEEGFLRRVEYFMKKAAVNVLGEDDQTAGHADRIVYAKTVLAGSASIKDYAIAVATNATIAAALESGHTTVSDNDLEFAVNSMFSDFAGYDG